MAKDDDDWYIPYNGPIEPPRPRTRPRGNTFGVAGMDSAPKAGTTLDSNEDSTFNTLHNLHSRPNAGRPRAESHASSTLSQSSYTRSFFGGGTSSGGIGEAPVHSSHRDKDLISTYSGRALSIYSLTREKGDRGSMLSADWEKSEQRASIASFLTFGRNRSRRRTASPSSPSSPQRGRAGSPMSYLSPRQSQESFAPSIRPPERVVMPPIVDTTHNPVKPLNPRRHLAPLIPAIGPWGQLTIATPSTGSGSASSASQVLPRIHGAKAGQLQLQRNRSFRSRSNTVDSITGGRGKINPEVRERIEEAEELARESIEPNHQSRASSTSLPSANRNSGWYEEPSCVDDDAQDNVSVTILGLPLISNICLVPVYPCRSITTTTHSLTFYVTTCSGIGTRDSSVCRRLPWEANHTTPSVWTSTSSASTSAISATGPACSNTPASNAGQS